MTKLWVDEEDLTKLQIHASTVSMLLAAVAKRFGEEVEERFNIVLTSEEMNEVEGWAILFGTRIAATSDNGSNSNTEYWISATADADLINLLEKEQTDGDVSE